MSLFQVQFQTPQFTDPWSSLLCNGRFISLQNGSSYHSCSLSDQPRVTLILRTVLSCLLIPSVFTLFFQCNLFVFRARGINSLSFPSNIGPRKCLHETLLISCKAPHHQTQTFISRSEILFIFHLPKFTYLGSLFATAPGTSACFIPGRNVQGVNTKYLTLHMVSTKHSSSQSSLTHSPSMQVGTRTTPQT